MSFGDGWMTVQEERKCRGAFLSSAKPPAFAMGTLAKRIGQLAARSVESESSNIIKTISANKSGLSKALDTTLRTSHDMKVFGLGTAASMASLPRYARFTASMHAVYGAMETSMDQSQSPAVAHTWGKFSGDLRRAGALQADLNEATALMGHTPADSVISPSEATSAYVAAIEAAARSDDETGGARLLGHLYCRYFADLFGGQALAGPYRWALNLGAASPRHYDFGDFGKERRASIEKIYEALNESGEMLGTDEACEAVVDEARVAFRHNVLVYKEEGRLLADGALGMLNMAGGFARSRFSG